MSEQQLIDFLSKESDKLADEFFEERFFDIEICGWKDNKNDKISFKKNDPEPAKFRIRKSNFNQKLSRSTSNKSYLSTVNSSNGSRAASPCIEKLLKQSLANQSSQHLKSMSSIKVEIPKLQKLSIIPPESFQIHNLEKPRKQRKPIKIFKLHILSQGNEE